jgi:hypothetical protein
MPARACFAQIRRKATSSMRWLALLRKIRRARCRVGKMFLRQILLVDGAPDFQRLRAGLIRRQLGIAMK